MFLILAVNFIKMNNYLNISESARCAINIAQSYAKEYKAEKINVSHLLKALMHKESGLHGFLTMLKKDIGYISEWAQVRINEYSEKTNKLQEILSCDNNFINVFEEADNIRLKIGLDLIDSVCLLAAIVKPNYGYTFEQLKSLPLSENEILDVYLDISSINNSLSGEIKNDKDVHSSNNYSTGALYTYCIDKNSKAKDASVDLVIGRDKELNMITEILGRRNKPNVLLIGEPGVGKSALIDGFVSKINSGDVPALFKKSIVFELEISALLAGAGYKGEVEDRFKKIIKELKFFDKPILFIDEFHTIIDAKGSGGSGIANLLKPELARAELIIIGATTHEEYRKFIEPDTALNRRFETLIINEPDEITAVRMIQSLLPAYENHHGIKVLPEVVADSVHLAKRYIKDKRLPDASIDLLDRTLSAIRVMNDNSFQVVKDVKNQFEQLIESNVLNEADFLAELKWIHKLLFNRISPVLAGQLHNTKDIYIETNPSSIQNELQICLNQLLLLSSIKKTELTSNDILLMIAHKTGVPVGKIQTQERDKLLTIEAQLKKRVVGQDYAIKVLSDAIIESRSGIQKSGQPIGSFFFLGPTGTGKTELTKALAELLFDDERAMIRFDMSEFKEEHSAALLYGSPPGYIGYEEGGMLVNKIRQNPFSVILFDEIEKAHHSVFDTFLQIMDEGMLHDKLGKEGDFSNSIIIFTSNIASTWVTSQFGSGIQPSNQALMDIMSKSFRPEFLARISEIIPFAPIEEENIIRILDIQLNPLSDSLLRQGVELDINIDVRKYLALSDFTPRYGARQLSAIIRNRLRKPISKMLVCGELERGDILQVRLKNQDELLFTIIRKELKPSDVLEPVTL